MPSNCRNICPWVLLGRGSLLCRHLSWGNLCLLVGAGLLFHHLLLGVGVGACITFILSGVDSSSCGGGGGRARIGVRSMFFTMLARSVAQYKITHSVSLEWLPRCPRLANFRTLSVVSSSRRANLSNVIVYCTIWIIWLMHFYIFRIHLTYVH